MSFDVQPVCLAHSASALGTSGILCGLLSPLIHVPLVNSPWPVSAARCCSCPGLDYQLCPVELGWMDGAQQAALSIPFLP